MVSFLVKHLGPVSSGSGRKVLATRRTHELLLYTVTFDPGTGTGTPFTREFIDGVAQEMPSLSDTDFMNGSRMLVSWNTSSDGTGADYSLGGSYVITGDTTLYAKWIKHSSG